MADSVGKGNYRDVDLTGEQMGDNSQDSKMRSCWSISARLRDDPLHALSRLGRADGAGLLALSWFLLLTGFSLALGGAVDWIRAASALLLSVSGILSFVLIWTGGLLLALSLRSLISLRWSAIRGLIAAGLATILVTDVPWVIGATVTASRSDLRAIHQTCLETAQVALAIDALLVLTLALGALLLLARQLQSRVAALRSMLVGGVGFAMAEIWAAHGWHAIRESGVHPWELGLVVALMVGVYAVGRWRGQRTVLFSRKEVIRLQEMRERYRARGLTP